MLPSLRTLLRPTPNTAVAHTPPPTAAIAQSGPGHRLRVYPHLIPAMSVDAESPLHETVSCSKSHVLHQVKQCCREAARDLPHSTAGQPLPVCVLPRPSAFRLQQADWLESAPEGGRGLD